MVTAYELYMLKQASEAGAGLGSLMHLADDIPLAYHWLRGKNPEQQQPAPNGIEKLPRPTP